MLHRILILCLFSFGLSAQSLQLAWFTQNDQFNIIDSQMDPWGNIVVAGTFTGIVDFDHGPHDRIDTAVGVFDMFIAKYDAYGNMLWVHSLGNNNPEKITALDVDAQGNIYAVGEFTRSMDFDPGPGVSTLSVVGYADVFLWALKPNGDFRFAKAFGDASLESPKSIDVNDNGEIVIAGYFWGTGDMDPSTAYYPVSSKGLSDIFVMRLHPGGNLWWVRDFGSSEEDQALNVRIGNNDEVYLQGFFEDSVDFDPDTTAGAEYWLDEKAGGPGFYLKLDPFGRFESAFNNELVPQKMELQNDENIFFSGYFSGTQDFDPDSSTTLNLSAVGNQTPLFLWKLDSSWTVDWAIKWPEASLGKNSISLAQDGSEGIAISGPFTGSLDLDPGNGVNIKTSKGMQDIFAVHVDSAGVYQYGNAWGSSLFEYPAAAFIGSNGEFYVAGRFQNIVDFDPDPAIVDNGQALGLESFMLKLTYCQEGYGYDTVYACNRHTWINNYTYRDSRSGDRYIMQGAGGCDSLIFLHLVMNFVDTTVIKINDTTFRSGQSFATSYQWLDCDSMVPIPGANQQNFIPMVTGNYAVIVRTPNCLDTSDCVFYEHNDFSLEEERNLNFSIFPNPSNGQVTLHAPGGLHGSKISLSDIMGRIIWREEIKSNGDLTFELPEESGIYLIHVIQDGQAETMRIIRR